MNPRTFPLLRKLVSTLLALGLILSSGQGVLSAQAASQGAGRAVPPAAQGGPDDPVIPSRTKVVTLPHSAAATAMAGQRSFSLPTGNPRVRGLRPGDILVSGPSPSAPNGYLVKVLAVTRRGRQVRIETEPASLTDAIQQGSIEIGRSLSTVQVRDTKQLQGVGLQAASPVVAAPGVEVRLDRVILADLDGDPATTDDQVVANGRVRMEPAFSLKMRIRHFEVQEFAFISQTRETAELELLTQVDLVDYHLRKEVARYTFAPIVVWLGSVPVVFTPVLVVNIGLDGKVSVGITASMSETSTYTSGARYSQGSWSPVAEVSHQFSYQPPSLSAGASFVASTGPLLTILVYGVAGPYAETVSYLELVADTLQNPWWQLFVGVRADVGVRVEVFGRVLEYEANVYNDKWLLAAAEGGFPAAAVLPIGLPPPTDT